MIPCCSLAQRPDHTCCRFRAGLKALFSQDLLQRVSPGIDSCSCQSTRSPSSSSTSTSIFIFHLPPMLDSHRPGAAFPYECQNTSVLVLPGLPCTPVCRKQSSEPLAEQTASLSGPCLPRRLTNSSQPQFQVAPSPPPLRGLLKCSPADQEALFKSLEFVRTVHQAQDHSSWAHLCLNAL